MTAVSQTEPGKFASLASTVNPFFSASAVRCRGRKSGFERTPNPTGETPVPRGMGVPPMSPYWRSLETCFAPCRALPVAEIRPLRTLAACCSG
jgi:hypothetical protein